MVFLKEQVTQNGGAMLLRRIPEINHIFEELYHTDLSFQQEYARLKVLEILLTMQIIPYEQDAIKREYFRSSEISRVKALHDEAISRLDERIPLQRLARQYNLPLTALKACFKEIYGRPYSAYMKRYRMHKAVHYLEDENRSITEIAGLVGYENASKFSAAFRSVFGCTPREYKKNADQMEHLRLLGVEIE